MSYQGLLLKDVLTQHGYDTSMYSENILAKRFDNCTAQNSTEWEAIEIIDNKGRTRAFLNGNNNEDFAYMEEYRYGKDEYILWLIQYDEQGKIILINYQG